MLREKRELTLQAHKFLDICLTAAAFIAAYFIKDKLLPAPFRGLLVGPDYHIVLLMIIIIWYVIFDLFGVYAPYRRRTFGGIFWNMVKAVSTGMVVVALFMYMLKITDVSRIMMGIFFLLNMAFLAASKGVVYYTLARYRKKGFNFRNVLIIGSRERAKDVIDATSDYLGSGFRILGCLEADRGESGKDVKNGIHVIGTIDSLEEVLRNEVVDELIFAMPLRQIENVDQHIAMAEDLGVSVRIIPDWQIHRLTYRPHIASIHFEEFLGLPTMTLHSTSANTAHLLIKSTVDYAVGGLAMLLLLPLFLLISFAIKISSRGPVFFKQERSGLNGRRFILYKFRTMVADAEERREALESLNETDGPVFKIKKDPRIIPFLGPLLRRTGLDELPQLINVLKGEMSLIGPRPPIPEEVDKYDIWQRRRLSMKPGLTCLWQITPDRNDISFDEWMKMDLQYIDNWSLFLDLKISLATVKAMLMGAGR